MKTVVSLSALFVLMAGCNATSSPSKSDTLAPHDLAWIVGCWAENGGKSREVWAQEADMLFGHSVSLKEDKVEFFEQMRIENSSGGYSFIVSPYGGPFVTFTQKERGQNTITFVNAENDYPQIITYVRNGNDLNAVISVLDGSNPTPFDKTACS